TPTATPVVVGGGGVAGVVAGGVAGGVARGVAGVVAFGVAVGVALSFSMIRPESWLLGSLTNYLLGKKQAIILSRVTYLPLPFLTNSLSFWLIKDWESGLNNLNQLLSYSLQFIPVINAINQVLQIMPSKQLIYRVSQLAENTTNWDLVKFCSVSLNNAMTFDSTEFEFRLDTFPRAVAAGFWYLHNEKPLKAKEAFREVRSLLYGEEMYVLADIISQFYLTEDIPTIASLYIDNFPDEPYLRPTTWDTIKVFCNVIEDVKIIDQGTNRLARSSALNRAIGELQSIININSQNSHPQQVPKTERSLILEIAEIWQTALQNIAKDVGEIVITEPIPMPYVIGPPVEGQLFAGREDILRELQQLWASGQTMQSVVLYGHRRMGKTSILKNINHKLGKNVRLVYTNLQGLGDIQNGMSEVLMAIGSDIAKTLKIEPPKTEDLLTFPEITFKNFLEDALTSLPNQGLMIALDEFEVLEELVNEGKIKESFTGVLRSWTNLSSRLGFIFAGLHTLEEKIGDYDQPFFASFIPLRVSFLDQDSTGHILAEPNEDFPLNYAIEVLEKIHQLTSGQPFLVQLIGFQLVSRYNKQLQQQSSPKNTIRLGDLEAIINKQFFQRGNYYFQGVWKQAAEDVGGQQEILEQLTPHREGLTETELLNLTQLNQPELMAAIDALKRHDVIQEIDEKYTIIVELFRQWLEIKLEKNNINKI
ncbi:MAG TPA: ATPase, partial [Cyanothece sp. UBA12306]|nr:ATPase [Cyanothece sp. UBA12306]